MYYYSINDKLKLIWQQMSFHYGDVLLLEQQHEMKKTQESMQECLIMNKRDWIITITVFVENL